MRTLAPDLRNQCCAAVLWQTAATSEYVSCFSQLETKIIGEFGSIIHQLGLTTPVCHGDAASTPPPQQTPRPEKCSALTCQVAFGTGMICADTLDCLCPSPSTCPAPSHPHPSGEVIVAALSDSAENVSCAKGAAWGHRWVCRIFCSSR